MAPRAHKRARTFRQGDKAGRKPRSLLVLQAEQHSLPSWDSAHKYRATTCQPSPLPCIYVRVFILFSKHNIFKDEAYWIYIQNTA